MLYPNSLPGLEALVSMPIFRMLIVEVRAKTKRKCLGQSLLLAYKSSGRKLGESSKEECWGWDWMISSRLNIC